MVAGMSLSSSPVAADTTIEFNLNDATATTSQGEVAYVAHGIQGMVTWENHTDPFEYFDLTSSVHIQGEGWEEIHTIRGRDVDNDFGRDPDTSESGRDGHLTYHIPNPDGTWREFSGGEEGEENDPEDQDIGLTWTTIADAERMADLDEEDLPHAVDTEPSGPEDPRDPADLPVPGDDEEETRTIIYRKAFTFYDGDPDNGGEVVDEITGEASFDLTIVNEGGATNIQIQGQTAADGV